MEHTPITLAQAFKYSTPIHRDRSVERRVTLHEEERGTTVAVLSIRHDKDSKSFRRFISIQFMEKRDGSPFTVMRWLPMERRHNQALPRIPVARYSVKALSKADADTLGVLTDMSELTLGLLDLGPYNDGDL